MVGQRRFGVGVWLVIAKVELRKVWFDVHMCELSIEATDGEFSGATTVYADRDEPAGLADAIEGFPASLEDHRGYSFGSLEPDFPLGGAALMFYCIDSLGHAFVEVLLHGRATSARSLRSVLLAFAIEAAAIDRFVAQLRLIADDGMAILANRDLG